LSAMNAHQTTTQTSGGMPSRISNVRQSAQVRIQPESGAITTEAIGTQNIQYELARARSCSGNQRDNKTSVAGQTPPSATPNRNRTRHNSTTFCTSPLRIAKIPQAISAMVTNLRALQTVAQRPPGTCNNI